MWCGVGGTHAHLLMAHSVTASAILSCPILSPALPFSRSPSRMQATDEKSGDGPPSPSVNDDTEEWKDDAPESSNAPRRRRRQQGAENGNNEVPSNAPRSPTIEMVHTALPWAERVLSKLVSKEACLVSGLLVTVVGLLTQNGSMHKIAVVAGNFFVCVIPLILCVWILAALQRQQRGGGHASSIFIFAAAILILAIAVLFCSVSLGRDVCWTDESSSKVNVPRPWWNWWGDDMFLWTWTVQTCCQYRLAGIVPWGR